MSKKVLVQDKYGCGELAEGKKYKVMNGAVVLVG